MKKYIIVLLMAFVLSPVAYGATDSYLKIGGVEGDSTRAPSRGTTTTSDIATPKDGQEAQVDVFLKIEGVEGEANKDDTNNKYKETEEEKKIQLGENALATEFAILVGETDEELAELAKNRTKIIILLKDGMEEEGTPVEEIRLNFEKIKTNIIIEVKREIKFLGVIPINAKAEVDMNTTGKVKVKFPWWAFLASGKNKEELGGKVFSTLSNVLKTKHDTVKNSIGNTPSTN